MGAHLRNLSIDAQHDGDAFTLDAALLATSFGWSVEEFRAMMDRGLVTSMVERGEGDDAGTWRLSVRCGNRRWRAIMGPDGVLGPHHVDFLPPPSTKQK